MKTRFYTNLKEERIKAKLSQEKLAAELSVSKETIRKTENMISIPNVILAMNISAYFGKTVDEMFWS
jgi:DNA-binding XRE family transcriptional regulator